MKFIENKHVILLINSLMSVKKLLTNSKQMLFVCLINFQGTLATYNTHIHIHIHHHQAIHLVIYVFHHATAATKDNRKDHRQAS